MRYACVVHTQITSTYGGDSMDTGWYKGDIANNDVRLTHNFTEWECVAERQTITDIESHQQQLACNGHQLEKNHTKIDHSIFQRRPWTGRRADRWLMTAAHLFWSLCCWQECRLMSVGIERLGTNNTLNWLNFSRNRQAMARSQFDHPACLLVGFFSKRDDPYRSVKNTTYTYHVWLVVEP